MKLRQLGSPMSPEAATATGTSGTDTPSTGIARVAALECRGLTVGYDDVSVLADLDLVVEAGQTLALLGPSGSGKTTLLHTIAGFICPNAGELLIEGRTIATPDMCVAPEKRGVAMVFQNYALWPHMTALDNVAYPLRRSGLRRHAAQAAAYALLDSLGAAELAHRRPSQLSGGQQQRVGIARALARRGGVTLLDEPTAHLDPALRGQVQDVVDQVVRPSGGAVIYATHDAVEALAIADRVALLRGGRLLQVGTAREIYEEPCEVWAARLTGPASVLRARLLRSTSPALPVEDKAAIDDDTWWLVRPEWTALGGPLPGEVRRVHYRGAHTDYTLATPAGHVVVRAEGSPVLAVGATTTWALRRAWPIPMKPDVDTPATSAISAVELPS